MELSSDGVRAVCGDSITVPSVPLGGLELLWLLVSAPLQRRTLSSLVCLMNSKLSSSKHTTQPAHWTPAGPHVMLQPESFPRRAVAFLRDQLTILSFLGKHCFVLPKANIYEYTRILQKVHGQMKFEGKFILVQKHLKCMHNFLLTYVSFEFSQDFPQASI